MLFGKWSGTEVKIDGQELLIMKESDIMGVIERGAVAKTRRPRKRALNAVYRHRRIREARRRGGTF